MDWLFGKSYKLWVINTTSEFFLYTWDKWHLLLPNMNAIVGLSQNPAFIRTSQSFEYENKWLGFGRMIWNEENNKKWTTKYRQPEYKDKNLSFFDTEIWTPDWNQCIKSGTTPEIFIKVYHNPNIECIREGIIIAIPTKTAQKYESIIESNVDAILTLIPNATLSIINRSWTPNRKFYNSIEYMGPQELEKIIYSCE